MLSKIIMKKEKIRMILDLLMMLITRIRICEIRINHLRIIQITNHLGIDLAKISEPITTKARNHLEGTAIHTPTTMTPDLDFKSEPRRKNKKKLKKNKSSPNSTKTKMVLFHTMKSPPA